MTNKPHNSLVVFLSRDNRPLRILLFGSILLALIIKTLLGWLLGVQTNTDDDMSIAGVVVIAISILGGFGAGFFVFFYLEKVNEELEQDDG